MIRRMASTAINMSLTMAILMSPFVLVVVLLLAVERTEPGTRRRRIGRSCFRLPNQIHDRLQQGFVVEAAFGKIVIRAGFEAAQSVLLTVFVGNDHYRERIELRIL